MTPEHWTNRAELYQIHGPVAEDLDTILEILSSMERMTREAALILSNDRSATFHTPPTPGFPGMLFEEWDGHLKMVMTMDRDVSWNFTTYAHSHEDLPILPQPVVEGGDPTREAARRAILFLRTHVTAAAEFQSSNRQGAADRIARDRTAIANAIAAQDADSSNEDETIILFGTPWNRNGSILHEPYETHRNVDTGATMLAVEYDGDRKLISISQMMEMVRPMNPIERLRAIAASPANRRDEGDAG